MTENIIGKRLRTLRLDKNMSQDEVANILGVGRTTYAKYESGENRPVRKLRELSELFGVSSDYILGNTPEMASERIEKIPEDVTHGEELIKELFKDKPKVLEILNQRKGLYLNKKFGGIKDMSEANKQMIVLAVIAGLKDAGFDVE